MPSVYSGMNFSFLDKDINKQDPNFDKFRKSLRGLQGRLKQLDNTFYETINESQNVDALLGKAGTRKEFLEFIEKNFSENLKFLEDYINERLVPFYLKAAVFKAVLVTREFNINFFFEFLRSIDYRTGRFIEFALKRKPDNKVDLSYNLDTIGLSTKSYSYAVERTREDFKVKNLNPIVASRYWRSYYQAAREGQKIYKSTKKGLKDITQSYAERYWRTIRHRIQFLDKDSIPFFEILQKGSYNVKLSSSRGGIPYPAYAGYDIIGEVVENVNRVISTAREKYTDYLLGKYPEIDIEIPQKLGKEELERLCLTFLSKGILTKEDEALLLATETKDEVLRQKLRDFLQSLGYKGVKASVIQTRKANFSLVVRMPDGKFGRWAVK